MKEKHKTIVVETDKEVKVQNSVHAHKIQNSIDSGLNVQKTVDNIPKVEKPVENNVPRVNKVTDDEVANDVKLWKGSSGVMKVQKVSENEAKSQSVSENDVKVQNSLEKVQNSRDSAPIVQRSPVTHVEEVLPATCQVTKEEEPVPRVKENELATPSSWTGDTKYIANITNVKFF